MLAAFVVEEARDDSKLTITEFKKAVKSAKPYSFILNSVKQTLGEPFRTSHIEDPSLVSLYDQLSIFRRLDFRTSYSAFQKF